MENKPKVTIPPLLAEKIRIITEIHGQRGAAMMSLIVRLFDILIEETRIANDTVAKDLLLLNQGEIAAYKKLKKYIDAGVEMQNS